jgi:hypothetical protein
MHHLHLLSYMAPQLTSCDLLRPATDFFTTIVHFSMPSIILLLIIAYMASWAFWGAIYWVNWR